jgi:hypothetical protein
MSDDQQIEFSVPLTPMTLAVRQLKCPTCSWTCPEGEGLGISFLNSELNGDYCLRCYAEDLAKRIPRLQKVLQEVSLDGNGEMAT